MFEKELENCSREVHSEPNYEEFGLYNFCGLYRNYTGLFQRSDDVGVKD